MNKLIASLLFACGVATSAANPPTNVIAALTLQRAFDLAERKHPGLAESKALVDAAGGRAERAGKLPNPEGIARIESAPMKRRTFDDAEYLAGVAQPVPLGGRLGKARQVEQLERERLERELEVRRRELHRRVHSAFATALYQEKAWQAQKELVTGAEKLVATTKARVEAGDTLREDLARAEMEQARARVELHRAEAAHEQAMAALNAAIGDPALAVKSLEGSLEAAFEIPTLESLAAGLGSHPAMALADADLRASSARAELARAERIPDVKVDVLYRRLQAEKVNAFDVGVSVPLPVFDRNQGRLREARAEAAAAEARSRSIQNDLAFRLRDAHSKLTAALAGSRALKTEILPRADTVWKAAEARYAAGDISLAEVLPARRDRAAAQLGHLESLRDVMQAWAEVRALGGK